MKLDLVTFRDCSGVDEFVNCSSCSVLFVGRKH
jgi:hypothetical protein